MIAALGRPLARQSSRPWCTNTQQGSSVAWKLLTTDGWLEASMRKTRTEVPSCCIASAAAETVGLDGAVPGGASSTNNTAASAGSAEVGRASVIGKFGIYNTPKLPDPPC